MRTVKFASIAWGLCCFALALTPVIAESTPDAVKTTLMTRHLSTTRDQLETMAGGQDALVKQLLELRHEEHVPFVGMRAEKLLLQYADRPEVRLALEEDLRAPRYKGLAKAIAIHVDTVPDSAAREGMAKLVIERAKQDPSYMPYARMLRESSDENVRELAREALD